MINRLSIVTVIIGLIIVYLLVWILQINARLVLWFRTNLFQKLSQSSSSRVSDSPVTYWVCQQQYCVLYCERVTASKFKYTIYLLVIRLAPKFVKFCADLRNVVMSFDYSNELREEDLTLSQGMQQSQSIEHTSGTDSTTWQAGVLY